MTPAGCCPASAAGSCPSPASRPSCVQISPRTRPPALQTSQGEPAPGSWRSESLPTTSSTGLSACHYNGSQLCCQPALLPPRDGKPEAECLAAARTHVAQASSGDKTKGHSIPLHAMQTPADLLLQWERGAQAPSVRQEPARRPEREAGQSSAPVAEVNHAAKAARRGEEGGGTRS